KSGILDPQGKTVNNALHHLGLTSVQNVRIGKLIEFTMEESDRGKAVQHVEEACRKLLSNPVIEDYSYEIEEG
ncbi:MAG: phosphoribosylformylglycinamidine synthase subunit PurS, partial [Calditrichaeota bacterium]